MRYYLVAGEASGDMHGANLMRAIKAQDLAAQFRFWGGDDMASVGGELVKHYRNLAFMGFVEVLFNLRTIIRNIKFCKKDIKDYQPDRLIFIDYPGFNLRIARWAKSHGYGTYYYISPQIWAWKESRIKQIKRDIDQMYVILPFEKYFYEQKHHYPVHFVGHPLLDTIARREPMSREIFIHKNHLDERPIIALLPGSRQQEIRQMLREMVALVQDFKNYQFVIAAAPAHCINTYEAFLNKNVRLIFNQTYDLLSVAEAALVTSGTATLETALFKVPEVVCYKGNHLSYLIAKNIITLKYISLVNLIMDKEVVKELIQSQMTVKNLKKELRKILDPSHRQEIIKQYTDLEQCLGGVGASEKVARLLISSENP